VLAVHPNGLEQRKKCWWEVVASGRTLCDGGEDLVLVEEDHSYSRLQQEPALASGGEVRHNKAPLGLTAN
jgi:hypothetical protein